MIIYQTDLNNICESNLKGFFVGWAHPLSPKQHLKILENSEYIVLAVESDSERVIGFVNALSDGVNFAFIPMLEVLPKYQKKGIGSTMMHTLLNNLKDIVCIDLTCDENMQGFYQRFSMLKSHGMILRKYMKPNRGS